MIIDTHTHVISSDRVRYPLITEERSEATDWVLDHAIATDDLLMLMRQADVDGVVLVQAMTAYGTDNRFVIDEALSHADRCVGIAAVDLMAPDAVDVVKVLIGQGMRGIRIRDLRSGDLGSPMSIEVAKTAAELNVPLVVLTDQEGLPDLRRVLVAVPEVRVVLDHCAFPDLAAGPPWRDASPLFALAKFENLFLKVTSVTLDLAPRGTLSSLGIELVSRFGAHRMMWGSDYAHTHDRSYAALVALAVDTSGSMAGDETLRFFGGTALQLWPELRGGSCLNEQAHGRLHSE